MRTHSRKQGKNLCVAMLVLSIFSLQSCSSDDSENNIVIGPDLQTTIDNYLESEQSPTQPGMSILVRKDGNVVYKGNKGMARISDMHSINGNTGFRIGSITKPFTALGIMMLIEQNQISLDDHLVGIVPGLPLAYENITIGHLLSHQAGLLDFIDDNTDLTSLDGMTTTQIIESIPNSGLDNLLFEPGASAEYSNTGYVFLALVIEEISGMSYPSFMKTNIFDKIGMNNSFVIHENQHLGDLNNNFALNYATDIKVKGFDSLIYGSSGIVSSIHDLNLFVEALLSNEIVSQESLELMIQPLSSIDWLGDYGLGWITGTGTDYWHQQANLTDSNDFWHIGGFDGYRTILSINPDLKLEVIILTNNGDTSQEHSNQILRLVRKYYKANN